jgi:hypothetical protein
VGLFLHLGVGFTNSYHSSSDIVRSDYSGTVRDTAAEAALVLAPFTAHLKACPGTNHIHLEVADYVLEVADYVAGLLGTTIFRIGWATRQTPG